MSLFFCFFFFHFIFHFLILCVYCDVALNAISTDSALSQALDTFNTAVVSPIYYALFTSFTILASAIMFKVSSFNVHGERGERVHNIPTIFWTSIFCILFQDYSGQSASSIASELCGFITVLSGTVILHSTREPDPPIITGMSLIPYEWANLALPWEVLLCYIS